MNELHAPNLTAPECYPLGSFDLTAKQRDVMATALSITSQMRQEGDGVAADAARAVIILRGAGLLDVMNEQPSLQLHDDIDRNISGYMDGVEELLGRIPYARLFIPCTCQHGC